MRSCCALPDPTRNPVPHPASLSLAPGLFIPRCRLSWLCSLPRGSEVTRRLPSQWPPLKSSFPSGATASARPLTPLPGTHGPLSSFCSLNHREHGSGGWATGQQGS